MAHLCGFNFFIMPAAERQQLSNHCIASKGMAGAHLKVSGMSTGRTWQVPQQLSDPAQKTQLASLLHVYIDAHSDKKTITVAVVPQLAPTPVRVSSSAQP